MRLHLLTGEALRTIYLEKLNVELALFTDCKIKGDTIYCESLLNC